MAIDGLHEPSRPGAGAVPGAARSLEAGLLLIGVGSILLLISLFLTWYRSGLDAWTTFEAWDLVLAALAVVALVAVMSRLGFGPPRPASWLIGPAVAALVIMVFLTINPPPAVSGADANGTGLWLALVASLLMAIGAVLSVARFSVAFTPVDPVARRDGAFGADPAAARRSGGRFTRADPAIVDPSPAEPGATTPTEPTRRI